MKPYNDITDPRVVKALAHPVRAQILGALQDRVASPNTLSRELGVPLGSVSYHVQRLIAFGFLKLVRKTPRRGAIEHYYTAIARPRITDAAWAEVPPIVKRAMVSATLEHLARHVNAAAGAGGFDIPDANLSRIPLTVDTAGWRALAAELDAVTERVQAIAADSAARLAEGGPDDAIDASVVLMLFRSAPGAAKEASADARPAGPASHQAHTLHPRGAPAASPRPMSGTRAIAGVD